MSLLRFIGEYAIFRYIMRLFGRHSTSTETEVVEMTDIDEAISTDDVPEGREDFEKETIGHSSYVHETAQNDESDSDDDTDDADDLDKPDEDDDLNELDDFDELDKLDELDELDTCLDFDSFDDFNDFDDF